MEIKKPIFIIGVPRTGSTLLYNILCLHPELAWFSTENFPEWASEEEKVNMKKHFFDLKKNNKKIPVTEESLFVFGKDWEEGLSQTKVHPDLKKIPIEGEFFWRKYLGDKYTRSISDGKKQEIISELEKLIKEQQKSRFLNKAPQNTMRLFAIQNIFSDAKFVNLIRDPHPVVSSMLQLYKKEGHWDPGIIFDKKKIEKLDLIEQFAWIYNEMTEEIYEFSLIYKKNFITVAYEDLISKSEEIILKILNFCELEIPENFNNMIPKIKSDRERWKENLTKQQQKIIFNMTKKSIKKMNYPYKPSLINWFIRKFR